MELWDVYDKDFNKVRSMTIIRGEPVPEGFFHLVCDVIVQHTDGSFLLMQRDERKPYGGMWEATAGGSALQGETPLECAVRELREETGISADHLTELGRVRGDYTFYVEYLCVTDCKKDGIVLQDGETVAYKWVSGSELASMRESELITKRMQRFLAELRP